MELNPDKFRLSVGRWPPRAAETAREKAVALGTTLHIVKAFNNDRPDIAAAAAVGRQFPGRTTQKVARGRSLNRSSRQPLFDWSLAPLKVSAEWCSVLADAARHLTVEMLETASARRAIANS